MTCRRRRYWSKRLAVQGTKRWRGVDVAVFRCTECVETNGRPWWHATSAKVRARMLEEAR